VGTPNEEIGTVTEAAGELRDGTAPTGDEVFEAPAVLRIVWADPQHMAEHIAVWSLAHFGPRADTAVKKLRNDEPDADRDELERLVVERQMHVATTEGAFVGGPFIVLIPFAFCAALLAQAQMIYELAAVAGHEPNDRMRAAELLVLLGAYDSTDEAMNALATMAREPRSRERKRLPRGPRWQMVKRMAYLLGLFGAGDDTRSRLRVALGWTGIGVLCLVGFVLPLVWVPYMAYSTRRSTLVLGARARTYYAAHTGDAGVVVRRRHVVRVGGTAALARTAFFVVLPIGAAVVALLTDFSFGGGRWFGSGLLLLVVSALVTLGWFGRRWWRHRPAHAQVA
jgi:hypothetical protein